MATSNRERIGQMFDLLSEPLGRFIAEVLGPQLPEGTTWIQLVALKDSENGIAGKTYSAEDPLVQLRMLTENIPHQVKKGWFPFDGRLSHGQKSFATELRDVRNTWAHGGSFSDDDAYRALDTAERLLNSIQEPSVADQIAKIRLNLRRVTAEKDDKRTLRAAATNSGSEGLRPWREVLVPHTDVATGNFASSEFAADLYKVANEPADAGSDYADPVEFFARTYLTDGLRDLITIAVRRLSGDDNAPPVVNLQTNFGGGKTHSMLALYHLFSGTAPTELPGVEPVLQEELLLVMAPQHPLAHKRHIVPKDLVRQPFVLFEAGSNSRRTIEEFFARQQITPKVVTETENVEIIKAMVRVRLGISVIPYQAMAREVAAGQLACARIVGQTLTRETGWVHPRSARLPRAVVEMKRMLDVVAPRLKLLPDETL